MIPKKRGPIVFTRLKPEVPFRKAKQELIDKARLYKKDGIRRSIAYGLLVELAIEMGHSKVVAERIAKNAIERHYRL